jgi:hypothetical protein
MYKRVQEDNRTLDIHAFCIFLGDNVTQNNYEPPYNSDKILSLTYKLERNSIEFHIEDYEYDTDFFFYLEENEIHNKHFDHDIRK